MAENTHVFSRPEYNLHFTKKKKQITVYWQFDIHVLIFIPYSLNIYLFINVKKLKTFKMYLFSVKYKVCSGLEGKV